MLLSPGWYEPQIRRANEVLWILRREALQIENELLELGIEVQILQTQREIGQEGEQPKGGLPLPSSSGANLDGTPPQIEDTTQIAEQSPEETAIDETVEIGFDEEARVAAVQEEIERIRTLPKFSIGGPDEALSAFYNDIGKIIEIALEIDDALVAAELASEGIYAVLDNYDAVFSESTKLLIRNSLHSDALGAYWSTLGRELRNSGATIVLDIMRDPMIDYVLDHVEFENSFTKNSTRQVSRFVYDLLLQAGAAATSSGAPTALGPFGYAAGQLVEIEKALGEVVDANDSVIFSLASGSASVLNAMLDGNLEMSDAQGQIEFANSLASSWRDSPFLESSSNSIGSSVLGFSEQTAREIEIVNLAFQAKAYEIDGNLKQHQISLDTLNSRIAYFEQNSINVLDDIANNLDAGARDAASYFFGGPGYESKYRRFASSVASKLGIPSYELD